MCKAFLQELKEANTFVAQHHRHHNPETGHKFSIAATVDGKIVDVAIAGRPISLYLADSHKIYPQNFIHNKHIKDKRRGLSH